MKLATFRIGGVHPPENKLSANEPIIRLPLPKQLFIPLSQNLGVAPIPVVKKGDEVKKGQLIARAEAFISANLHAPASGKIAKIDEVADASGYRRMAVFLDVTGDEWTEGIETSDNLNDQNLPSRNDILLRIKDAGIVGMGGLLSQLMLKCLSQREKGQKC